jgi:hypothetical protein
LDTRARAHRNRDRWISISWTPSRAITRRGPGTGVTLTGTVSRVAIRPSSVTIQMIATSIRVSLSSTLGGPLVMTVIRRAVRHLDEWTLVAFNPHYPVGSRS